MSAPLIRATGVGIRHEGAIGFRPSAVDLELHAGEVVLLLGPSGCGKSTFALALDGLVPHAVPSELRGTVLAGDLDTATTPISTLSGQVAMVFQDADASLVTGTVLDEVCFGPENHLVPRAEVLSRAEDALRRVGLWDRRDENPDRLSGGGCQRLAIAGALALASPVIVFDEPTANLDPVGIEEFYATLRELIAQGDRAVLLIEHNLDACVDLVTRVVVLDAAGRLAFTGTPHEVFAERTDELIALGVWLPVATLAALRLRAIGVELGELPLRGAQLRAALEAAPALPAPSIPAPAAFDGAPVVRARGLSIVRDRRPILRDLDLAVPAGAFLAIVGANGAGKTTLLQSLAGVIRPPRGAVSVAGLDPARADARALARAVGFVFQNPEHQFIRHTVADELAHGLELQRMPPERIAERVDRMLDRLGLQDERARHPFLLSGGQKRRLSVGTALIAEPPVLALDEPTFGQDRARANELIEMLHELNAEGTTVMIVTHDLQLVAECASHLAVLDEGRLAAFGPSAAVLAGDALDQAGLRPPTLAAALRGLRRHPEWRSVVRLSELPAPEPAGAR